MSELQCVVVTPESKVCEVTASYVAVTLYDGEIGIAPGHTPVIARAGCGELRIVTGEKIHRYYVSGGFLEVMSNTVTLLTDRAIPVDQIDGEAAAASLKEALEQSAGTPAAMAARDRLVAESRAQVNLAKKA